MKSGLTQFLAIKKALKKKVLLFNTKIKRINYFS
jgi:hypothetical protein